MADDFANTKKELLSLLGDGDHVSERLYAKSRYLRDRATPAVLMTAHLLTLKRVDALEKRLEGIESAIAELTEIIKEDRRHVKKGPGITVPANTPKR